MLRLLWWARVDSQSGAGTSGEAAALDEAAELFLGRLLVLARAAHRIIHLFVAHGQPLQFDDPQVERLTPVVAMHLGRGLPDLSLSQLHRQSQTTSKAPRNAFSPEKSG